MEATEMKNQIIWNKTQKESNPFGLMDKKENKSTSNLDEMVYVAPWHVYDQPS